MQLRISPQTSGTIHNSHPVSGARVRQKVLISMPAGHNKRKQEQGEGGDRKKRSWQSTVSYQNEALLKVSRKTVSTLIHCRGTTLQCLWAHVAS